MPPAREILRHPEWFFSSSGIFWRLFRSTRKIWVPNVLPWYKRVLSFEVVHCGHIQWFWSTLYPLKLSPPFYFLQYTHLLHHEHLKGQEFCQQQGHALCHVPTDASRPWLAVAAFWTLGAHSPSAPHTPRGTCRQQWSGPQCTSGCPQSRTFWLLIRGRSHQPAHESGRNSAAVTRTVDQGYVSTVHTRHLQLLSGMWGFLQYVYLKYRVHDHFGY